MEKEFTEHLFYVNRKESFWFHSIRSINYFCYKYWWLVLLLFSTIILLWLLFCLKPFQNQNTTCNGVEVFNERLNSINNSFNNCCNCNAGSVLSDIQGPAVINNIKWKNDERYSQINTVEYPTNLQRNFPPSVRKWSLTDMHNWSKGSCKIICQDMN